MRDSMQKAGARQGVEAEKTFLQDDDATFALL